MTSMFRHLLAALMFLLTISACAKPTYVAAELPGTDRGADDTDTCDTRFQKSGNCVVIDWQTQPTETDEGSFVFKISRPNIADQSPVPVNAGGTMNVRLFMPAMGHGSSPVKVTQVDTGTYRADNVYFTMHGAWQIIFEIRDGGPVVDTAILPFSY